MIGKQRLWLVTVVTVLLAGEPFLPQAHAVPASQPTSGTKSAPSGPTGVQIDNAESTSKPDDQQIPEANPARPTITNPAHIPPVGYLQFEQGLLQASGSPGGVSQQFSLVQTFRLSLHPRLMVQFQSQPFARSSLAGEADSPALSVSDAGDILAGGQAVLLKQRGRWPIVAVGYLERLHAGSAPDIDLGSFSRSAVVLVSGDLGSFHYDSNYIVSEQVGDPARRAQFGQTLSVTHPLLAGRFHNNLSASGELWHFTQPLVGTTRDGAPSSRSNAVGTLWALGYTVRPNLVLDAGFDRGLTSTSTAWQGFAGFTYLLPRRLWARR